MAKATLSLIPNALAAMHAALKRRDMDAIFVDFADNVRYVSPDGTLDGIAARRAVEQMLLDAFTDIEVKVSETVIQNDKAVEFLNMRGIDSGPLALPAGTIPPTGKNIDLRFTSFYRFEDGKVVFQEIIYDSMNLLRQLGLAG